MAQKLLLLLLQRVFKDLLGLKVELAHREHQELRVHKVRKELLDFKVVAVMMVRKDVMEHKVFKGAQEHKELLALMETPFFMVLTTLLITLEMLAISTLIQQRMFYLDQRLQLPKEKKTPTIGQTL